MKKEMAYILPTNPGAHQVWRLGAAISRYLNGIKITLGDTGIYDKGGVVKFVMFMGNEKVFLNVSYYKESNFEKNRVDRVLSFVACFISFVP